MNSAMKLRPTTQDSLLRCLQNIPAKILILHDVR
jgi:hypothetical protein